MKIAYITINNPKNYTSWSGLNYNIYKCLKSAGHSVTCIGPLKKNLKIFFVIKRMIYGFIGIKFDADRSISLSKYYSSQVSKKILNKKYDLILTSDTNSIAYLNSNLPIVLWLDASFKSWYKHYFFDQLISKKTLKEGNLNEQKAFNKSSQIFVTSKWAKNQILKFYNCSQNKIKILPFGSNLELNPSLRKILINKKNRKICKIISIGVDWERKGFDRTINICKKLKSKGLNLELRIVGPKISKNKNIPNWVKVYGFLDKNNSKNKKFISNLLIDSDFHVLMTKSEAYGVVFAEASAHGIFNIALNIGGIGGVIKNNVNGKLFKKSINDNEIADYIFRCFKNKNTMKNKILNSKRYYESFLDWYKIGKKFNLYLNKNINLKYE